MTSQPNPRRRRAGVFATVVAMITGLLAGCTPGLSDRSIEELGATITALSSEFVDVQVELVPLTIGNDLGVWVITRTPDVSTSDVDLVMRSLADNLKANSVYNVKVAFGTSTSSTDRADPASAVVALGLPAEVRRERIEIEAKALLAWAGK